MNVLTRKIRNKGYSLAEFCKLHDIALRTYRRREHDSHGKYQELVKQVEELEVKHEA